MNALINAINEKTKIKSKTEVIKSSIKYIEGNFTGIEKIILKKNANLNELNIELILLICEYLNININYYRSSSFNNSKDKNLNLIKICRKFSYQKLIWKKVALTVF